MKKQQAYPRFKRVTDKNKSRILECLKLSDKGSVKFVRVGKYTYKLSHPGTYVAVLKALYGVKYRLNTETEGLHYTEASTEDLISVPARTAFNDSSFIWAGFKQIFPTAKQPGLANYEDILTFLRDFTDQSLL